MPTVGDMTNTPHRLRIRSATDLLEVIPGLLGFHPEDSLVVVALQEGTIAVTARADLPPWPGFPVRSLEAVWRRFPDADLVVVACCPDPFRAWAALDALDEALPDGAGRMLIHADGELWFSDPDAPGEPYDARGGAALVEATYAGRTVRASRAELEALVDPARTPEEVRASLERVGSRLSGKGELMREALARVNGHDEAPATLDLDDVTLVCLATHDPRFMDAVILSADAENAEQRVAFWLQVVRGSVPNCAGPALLALGHAAWLTGDGALQVVCLEAASERPAPPEWFALLDLLNSEAVEPRAWGEVRDAVAAGLAEPDGDGS